MGLKTRSPGRKCANNTIEWGFEFDFDFKFEFQCDFDGGADGGVDRVNAAGVSRRKFLAPAQLTWMTCQLVCSPGRSTPPKTPFFYLQLQMLHRLAFHNTHESRDVVALVFVSLFRFFTFTCQFLVCFFFCFIFLWPKRLTLWSDFVESSTIKKSNSISLLQPPL